jgi:hypothetical protein
MRSLRSLHEKRACGPQNFRHLRQNDFCNTIPLQADIVSQADHVGKVPLPEVTMFIRSPRRQLRGKERGNLTSRPFELSNALFNGDGETRSYVCGEQEYVL